MEYSIDMVRLKTRVKSYDLSSLMRRLSFDSRVEYWQSFNFKDYHHNFRIQETEEFSYYLGIEHNMKKTELKKDVVIEFNPNKFEYSSDSLLFWVLFHYYYDDFVIVSVDVAVDIYVDINSLYFDRNYKRKYKYFKSDLGVTHYFGEGDGRVKVYDKKKEQESKGKKVDRENWTRIEYSIKVNENISNISKFYKKIQLVDIYKMSNIEVKDRTTRALLFAVNNGYDIKELSRDYRKKIKDIISQEKINISEEKINETIKKYFEKYEDMLKGYIDLIILDENERNKKSG